MNHRSNGPMRSNEKFNISRNAVFCGRDGRIKPIHPDTVVEGEKKSAQLLPGLYLVVA